MEAKVAFAFSHANENQRIEGEAQGETALEVTLRAAPPDPKVKTFQAFLLHAMPRALTQSSIAREANLFPARLTTECSTEAAAWVAPRTGAVSLCQAMLVSWNLSQAFNLSSWGVRAFPALFF